MSHLPPGSLVTKIEVTPSEHYKTRYRAKVFYLWNGEVRSSSFDGSVLKKDSVIKEAIDKGVHLCTPKES